MTRIKVITTKDRVYTTFFKTIHATEIFSDDQGREKAEQICKALAFSLATTAPGAICELLDLSNRVVTDQDIFSHLNAIHK